MEGTLCGGQTAGVGVTDNSSTEQQSPCDQQEQVWCEDVRCSDNDGVEEKPESGQTSNITQVLASELETARTELEICWYCLKSLSIEELNIQQVESDALTAPSGGERLKYQRDPRPHFGVAHSSRSVSFPLWDTDRPREMKEGEDEEGGVESVSCCPHCHLWLPRDTLLWHEVKCLLFDGLKSASK